MSTFLLLSRVSELTVSRLWSWCVALGKLPRLSIAPCIHANPRTYGCEFRLPKEITPPSYSLGPTRGRRSSSSFDGRVGSSARAAAPNVPCVPLGEGGPKSSRCFIECT